MSEDDKHAIPAVSCTCDSCGYKAAVLIFVIVWSLVALPLGFCLGMTITRSAFEREAIANGAAALCLHGSHSTSFVWLRKDK
jgi:hypothetical protein